MRGSLYAHTESTSAVLVDAAAVLASGQGRSGVKGGALWAPHVLHPHTTRSAAGVASVTALVYDCDGVPAPRLALAGWTHPTHTHPGERLVLLLTRELTPAEHLRLWPYVREHLVPASDPACRDASRMYYLPPPGAVLEPLPGSVPLDVDGWLAAAPTAPAYAPDAVSAAALAGLPHDLAAAIVAALVASYPVLGRRHAYRLAVAGTAAELGYSPELTLALLRDATAQVGGRLDDCDGVVRSSYRAGVRRQSGSLVADFGATALVRALEAPLALVTASRPPPPPDPARPHPPLDAVVPGSTWCQWFSDQHCVLTSVGASGKVRIFSWGLNDFGRVPVLQASTDFLLRYEHWQPRLEGISKPVAVAKWWLGQPSRAEATSLCFRPDRHQERLVDGRLNTWTSYGVEPRHGRWDLTRAYLRDVIAAGDGASLEYVLRWCAWVMQHPGERAEVVLVLKGAKGTGKNTLLDALCRMLGTHALTVSSPRHLTGNFNAHLQACALLFANEAIPPNDRAAEAVLKALVTDPTLAIERKGVDVEQCRNSLSICMASNEDWCVPAGIDERRFAVFQVSRCRIQDRAYFAAIHQELASGGLAAFLHDLLHLPLGDWHPRDSVPQTAALVEQQEHSFRGAERLVHDMLASGSALGVPQDPRCVDATGRVFVCTRLVTESSRGRVTETAMGRALRVIGTPYRMQVIHQMRGFWLPPLRDARAVWAAAHRLAIAWDDPDDEWSAS